jgi:hypothetical protein
MYPRIILTAILASLFLFGVSACGDDPPEIDDMQTPAEEAAPAE